ncbi:MAG: cyclic nucleotide-binding domain-containing protein [Gammaproteobacteria bacterium]
MGLDQSDIKQLRELVPLDALSTENFKRLLQQSTKFEAIKAGATLFKKGDTDRRAIYLVSGSVQLDPRADDDPEIIEAGSDDALHPLSPSSPRQHSCKAVADCKVARVDTNTLDIMLTWDQEAGGMEVMDVEDGGEGEEDNDWMTKLLANQAFYEIPPANIHTVLTRMEPMKADTGDTIIQQGDDGDYFYVIKSGTCEVIRETPRTPDGLRLAELKSGDSFGEDALISNNKRNATIRMLTAGELMRLAKADFIELLTAPVVEEVEWTEANKLGKEGAIWVDVRLPSEYTRSHIRGAVNLPLFFIRGKVKQLNAEKSYLIYCDTGRRSQAAAFVLAQHGIKATVVKGGLHGMAELAAQRQQA